MEKGVCLGHAVLAHKQPGERETQEDCPDPFLPSTGFASGASTADGVAWEVGMKQQTREKKSCHNMF